MRAAKIQEMKEKKIPKLLVLLRISEIQEKLIKYIICNQEHLTRLTQSEKCKFNIRIESRILKIR